MSGSNLLNQDEIWDDAELIRMYEESMSGKKQEASQKQWKIGDTCMAPYEDLWYAAKILSINRANKTVKVRFTEYEEDAVTFDNEREITNNMMLSWYMSGYHTGYFQAMRDFKKNSKR
ncbi:hypothetical protein FO519_006939 [Halicephalobus sp. NKZ332]|nr:hypothetical protein FO519_006939 [Halicephalobus sp. NKZ332]